MKVVTTALIDGNFSRRAQIVYALGKCGLRVVPFEDFSQFSSRCEGRRIVLVHDDGLSLEATIRWVRNSHKTVGVIAYSEQPELRSIVNAIKCGASDYVEWPVEPQALKAMIGFCIEQKEAEWRIIERKALAHKKIQTLTPRERQVLSRMTEGHSTRFISQCLGISPRTVEIHRAHILSKIHASNSLDAVRIAHEAGIKEDEFSSAA